MGALDGIRVLDLSILIQGPQAGAMLHDLGADVVKVELPGMGDLARWIPVSPEDPRAPVFEACNRGKRSVTLDLRQPGGTRAIHRLVEGADVLLHNFVPGTMERWGLGYEELSAINPRLVYGSGSTFGPLGPDAHREGADAVGQAWGGLISTTGTDDGELSSIGALIADHSGCQNLATGVLAALFHRERTGQGQKVEVSLLGGMIWAQATEMTYAMLTGRPLGRANRGHPLLKAIFRLVPTADGYIQLVGVPQPQFAGFCRAIEREDLIDNDRYNTLFLAPDAVEELGAILDETFPKRTTAEWAERLLAEGQRFAPVRDHAEVVADPAAVENGYVAEVDHPTYGTLKVVGSPLRMSATPTTPGVVAPELGQHTEEVLVEAGFGWEEIDELREAGAF